MTFPRKLLSNNNSALVFSGKDETLMMMMMCSMCEISPLFGLCRKSTQLIVGKGQGSEVLGGFLWLKLGGK